MADDGDDDSAFGLTPPFTPEKLALAFLKLGASQVGHNRGCIFQWQANNARLKRIEQLMIAAVGALIAAGAIVIWFFLTHLGKLS